MIKRLAAALAFCLPLIGGTALAQQVSVIELFTSQGCSSCPPADRLLGKLAQRADVIALSENIDYWDYLGWKDTLALPGHVRRQKSYAALRGEANIFTPQAVINGRISAVGSDAGEIEKSLGKAPALTIGLTMEKQDDVLKVTPVAGRDLPANTVVMLVSVTRTKQVEIGRGENRGETISYANVVRRWTSLGAWNGEGRSFEARLSEAVAADADFVVALVQPFKDGKPVGAILGAGKLDLR